MRVAVLCDVHGNLPALEAALADVGRERPDAVVVGGDVALGPQPTATLDRLTGLDIPTRFVMGNCDREMVEAYDAGARPEDTDNLFKAGTFCEAWAMEPRHRDLLAAFEPLVRLDVDGLGETLFCHGSPRSDSEIVTTVTPEERLGELLDGVSERVVVCGHTHRQFDRRHAGRRIVNAGAVGLPYEGVAAAFWAMLGPDVELRRSDYDVDAAVRTLRATGYPHADEAMLRESLIEPADPDEVARYFEREALS